MLAIEVEFLLGRSVATDVSSRDLAEWPPHPTRLFSAFVDALADLRIDSVESARDGEAALRWLEALEESPSLSGAVGAGDFSAREAVKYWVPVNDETMPKAKGMPPLVDRRKKQERYFPATVLHDPRVYFVWRLAEPTAEQRAALQLLAKRIPYLGHSSSVVRVSCVDAAPTPKLEPNPIAGQRMRVPGRGRLDRLETTYIVRKRDTLVQPPRGREVRYAAPGHEVVHGPHDTGREVAIEGVSLGLESTATLVERFREALLAHLGDDAPEVLTGHDESGAPSTIPHLAYAPLANVAYQRSDGAVKGLALVMPRDIDDEHVARLDDAARKIRTVKLGQRGLASVRYGLGDAPLRSQSFERYTAIAEEWVSVTPVALSLHPKPAKGLSFELTLLRDLERLGLGPVIDEVALGDVAFLKGPPRAREFSRGKIHSIATKVLRHVWVRFRRPVQGPLLVGAGRHMGFGLLIPRSAR